LISPVRRTFDSKDQNDWNPDLRMIKNKLQAYESSISRLLADQSGKQEKVNEIL
jgi:hypothetical protein